MIRWFLAWGLIANFQVAFGQAKEAYQALEEGRFDEAIELYQNALRDDPTHAEWLYNLGVAYHKKGQWQEAAQKFTEASKAQVGAEKARSLFNAGTSHIFAEDLSRAKELYKEALSLDLDNQKIKDNLAWVEEQLEKSQENKESPSDQEDQEDQDQKNQDQKNQDQAKDSAQNQKGAENTEEQNAENSKEDPAQKDPGSEKNEDSAKEDESQNQDQPPEQTGENKDDPAKEHSGEQKSQENLAEEKNQPEDGSSEDPKEPSPTEPESPPKTLGEQNEPEKGEIDPAQESSKESPPPVINEQVLKRQDAEKVIRSVEDKISKYLFQPTKEQLKERSQNGKDW